MSDTKSVPWSAHHHRPIDHESTRVILVITEPTPLRDQVMHARRQLAMRNALRKL